MHKLVKKMESQYKAKSTVFKAKYKIQSVYCTIVKKMGFGTRLCGVVKEKKLQNL